MELGKQRACDFCGELNTTRVLYVRRQVLPAGTPLDMLNTLVSNPEWITCEPCGLLIDDRNLTALLDRAMSGLSPKVASQTRPYFAKLYQSLLDNFNAN